MSGASGGVVFAGGSPANVLLGRYGAPVTLASGAVIPAGAWFLTAAWQIALAGQTGSPFAMAAGYCVSDGANATMTAAGVGIPLGA